MNMPPAFAVFATGSLPRIWLPLFLLWPLMAALIALLATLLWLAALASRQHAPSYRRCISVLWQLFCGLRGFQVAVDAYFRLSLY